MGCLGHHCVIARAMAKINAASNAQPQRARLFRESRVLDEELDVLATLPVIGA